MSRLAWSAIAALLVAAAPDLSAQWTNATSTGPSSARIVFTPGLHSVAVRWQPLTPNVKYRQMRSVPARYLAARPTALELPSVTRPALPPAKATKTP